MRFPLLRFAPALLLVLAACPGDSPAGPDTGSLKITVNATGTDPDNRFMVRVNDGAEEAYTGTALTREGLQPGSYTVRLSGVASNCTVPGNGQVQVAVTAGKTAEATFNLACSVRFVIFSQSQGADSYLYRVDRTGGERRQLTAGMQGNVSPSISPDGRKVAFTSFRDGNGEIYVMNVDGSGQTRLTNRAAQDHFPDWSPDGSRIVFASGSDGVYGSLWTMNADGSGLAQLPTGSVAGISDPEWSPDGTRIAFAAVSPNSSGNSIHVLTLATGTVARLTTNSSVDTSPSWTSDGRIVHTSFRGVRLEAYVMNPDGSGSTLLYMAPFGRVSEPRLSPDGSMLLYRGGSISGDLYVVELAGGTPLVLASQGVTSADWQQ